MLKVKKRQQMNENTKPLTIHRETRVDKIVDILENQIWSGKLTPGIKLSEARVAKEFNVSRAPAREALLRLEDVSLIRKSHLGREVVEFSIEEYREIYEIKNILEAYAAMQATYAATERDIKKLKSILDKMNDHLNPPRLKKLEILDKKFHDHIMYCSRNRRLIQLYEINMKKVRWTPNINYILRPRLSVKEHKEIL